MCKTSLHGFLAALPKCEHHMHLEGSLSPELLFSLAAKNSISLPTTTEDPAFASIESLYSRYDAFTSLDDFLAYYFIGFRVLLTQSDFEDLAYAYFERAHAANVRHAEVFFDPQAHTSRGVAYDTVVAGFVAAQARAQKDFGISSLLIPCLLRHLPVSDSVATFNKAKDAGHFSDGTLAGIGLCGSEVGFPPRLWKGIYDEAAAFGIRRTAHAGEEGPAAFVAAALDELGAMRVDHGINSAQDEALLERLARDGVMLTVCPLSNVRLQCVPAMSDMPIRRLLDKGVKFSVNSDDPAYFGGYIQENYCAVQEAFGLNVDEWVGIARNAVEGSWCGERRKSEILSEIENIVGDWREKLAA